MKRIFLVFSLLQSFSDCAQEQFGSSFSNYTPTQSVFMNPSSMLDAKTWLDIHIVGAGAFAINNMVSLRNTSAIQLINSGSEDFVRSRISYNRNRRVNTVYNRSFANALSAVWSQGNHAAGLFFNVRSYTIVRGIPKEAFGIIDDVIADEQFDRNKDFAFSNLNVSSLTFGEVQLSYAHTFFKKKSDMLMGGISIKKFVPLLGGAAQIYDVRFNQTSDTTLAYLYADLDAMYTNDISPNFRGGMGLDIGFTYQKMSSNCQNYYPNSWRSGCKQVPYKYKVGLSVLDIGSVKFDENIVQSRGLRINFDTTYFGNFSSVDTDSIFRVVNRLDSVFNDEDIRNVNKIHLPTALSLQFDYNLWKSKVYLNASLMQGLPISNQKFGARRPNSLMVGVRYESRIFDVSVPFSLFNYSMPQVGLSFRLYCLTIGTDKLLSFLGTTNIYGADIYAALKIPIFYYPPCKQKMKNSRQSEAAKQKGYRKKRNNCPAYD